MPDGLYERDALAWAEQQAALLRRVAAGERVNDVVDWAHVIEEVADGGLSELRACRSLLRQALAHLLKRHAEVAGFLTDGRDAVSPSMRQRIDLSELYADALYRTKDGDRDGPDLPPDTCPFVLDDLLAQRPDVGMLLAKLASG